MFKRLGTALRRAPTTDAMRTATAQTTLLLLEQNRKFEQWLRFKIDALDARVAAQAASRELTPEPWNDTDDLDALGEAWPVTDDTLEAAADSHPTVIETGLAETSAQLAEDDALPAEPVPDYLELLTGSALDGENAERGEDDEPSEDREGWT